MKTILILGAGTGGIIAAQALSKETGGNARILLFEREKKNVFAPSLLWLMVGKRTPEQIYRPTNKISGAGIEVIPGEIEKVDPEQISVTVNGKQYAGDYMIISLGAEQTSEHHLDDFGYDFYTLEGATRLNKKLESFKGGNITILVPSLPFKCPAAPCEAAMLIESYIRKKGLRGKTEICLYTPEPGPMPVAGQEVSNSVRQIVESKGIKYFSQHQIISAAEKTLSFENGTTAGYDLLAFTPKHQCPKVIKETALVGKSGWIEVNRQSMETDFANVYALGDITFIPLEVGKPLPKAGVFAHYEAEIVAHNLARQLEGKAPDKFFDGEGACFLELGDGKAGYASGNFYGSPLPAVKMKKPGYFWHWTKVLFEKYWFFKHFSR